MTAAVQALIDDVAAFKGDYMAMLDQEKHSIEQVKHLSPADQVEFVMASAAILANRTLAALSMLEKPVSAVLRKKLPFTPEQILQLVKLGENPSYYFPFPHVCRLAESLPRTSELVTALRAMQQAPVLRHGQYSGSGALIRRIDEILAGPPPANFTTAGSWSRAVAAGVTPAWRTALEAGKEITGSEPSKKWRVAAADRVAGIGREAFRVTALGWLALGPYPDNPGAQVDTVEADYQRGLLWSLAEFPDAETCSAVARFAEECLRKIPMLGAVCQKSGNACVKVLAAMESMDAVAQLSRLALRIRYHTAQRLVQEALEEAALRQGISREELEEITVPTFGLDEAGLRTEVLGEFVAELTASGGLSFRTVEGKSLKGAPAALKKDFAGDLKELKTAEKEIARMGSAHRLRLERLLVSQRAIPAERWRTVYIDHPLIGELARRVIWQFESGETALWDSGGMAGWNGAPVNPSGAARLWHPINSDVQTVLSWRCRLEDLRLRQPFKQAHREVYILTDAERETALFSNRFQGHILKQHPFAALCGQRGWEFKLMGQWDSHNTPFLRLTADLGVKLDVDFPQDEAVSGHMIYMYLSTGSVRFGDPASHELRRLETIPPVLFSEAMRDVDLFVGVCSIGNDPAWTQRPNAPFANYWESFSFGELSAAADVRKQMLERLLPKLPIRDRCHLDDRFLRVRGDRASYKIHLGSGSVIMEPGRGLCIVRGAAKPGTPSQVFLPFEGDEMLSIILSKAFLLADDRKITDPSITRQFDK